MSATWLAAIRTPTRYPAEYRPQDERRTLLMNAVIVAGNMTSATLTATLTLTPSFSLAATTQTIDGVSTLVSEPLLNGFYKR